MPLVIMEVTVATHPLLTETSQRFFFAQQFNVLFNLLKIGFAATYFCNCSCLYVSE